MYCGRSLPQQQQNMRFALVLFLLRGAHATVRKGFTIDGLPSQVDVVIHDGPTSCEADERVAKDDHVEMFYTGTIDASSETGTAGMQFDSNVGKSAFPFYVGEHSVIEGLDQGIVGLCVGSKAVFTIPPDMGYAERGAGSIPGGATLKFDVEVVSIGPTYVQLAPGPRRAGEDHMSMRPPFGHAPSVRLLLQPSVDSSWYQRARR